MPISRFKKRNVAVANLSTSGIVRPKPINHQLIASFTSVPNGAPVQMTSSYTANQGRNGHDIGNANCSRVKILDAQFRITPGSGLEAASPAATSTWQRSVELGSTTIRVNYGGSTSATLDTGGMLVSDEITGLTFPKNTRIYTRFYRTVPLDTDSLSVITLNGPSSQGFRTVSGNQLMSNGSLNNSGTGSGPAVWPMMILGIPDAPLASVVIVGDSIATYLNDTNTSTTQGFLTRAFQNVNGLIVPWHKQTIDANSLNNQEIADAPLQKQVWKYATDILIQLGTNDIASGASLATMKARFTDIAGYGRTLTGPYGFRPRIHATAIIPRGTFSGAQNTIRTDYNTWLAAGADGLVDQYYDTNAAAGDFTTYPSDQIHPGSSVHADMAAVVAAGFVPYLDPYYKFV
jgi:lysophospholipase L1-like esterase